MPNNDALIMTTCESEYSCEKSYDKIIFVFISLNTGLTSSESFFYFLVFLTTF